MSSAMSLLLLLAAPSFASPIIQAEGLAAAQTRLPFSTTHTLKEAAPRLVQSQLPFGTLIDSGGLQLQMGSRGDFKRGYSDYHVLTRYDHDYATYMSEMAPYGIDLQRWWITGYNNTGEGETMPFYQDGGTGLYDLVTIDAAWYNRARDVLGVAEGHGMAVYLALFDHWAMYDCNNFQKTPWYVGNNQNGILDCDDQGAFPAFFQIYAEDGSLNHLGQVQRTYVQNTVSELMGHGDITWEIMNEPNDGDPPEVAAWHAAVVDWVLAIDNSAQITVAGIPEFYKDDIYGMPQFDVAFPHGGDWGADCPPNDLSVYERLGHMRRAWPQLDFIADDDGTWVCRNAENAGKWANSAFTYGAAGFNHKGDIFDLDYAALANIQNAHGVPRVHSQLNKGRHHPWYGTGDLFSGGVDLVNYTDEETTFELFVVLELDDRFYYWPGWTEAVDSEFITLQPDADYRQAMLEFVWPATAPIHGMVLWSALLDPSTGEVADFDSVTFSYGG